MSDFKEVDYREVLEDLKADAERFVRYLFPKGKRKGDHILIGNVSGEKGNSLSICVSGAKCGLWHDFATGDGGNLITLWMIARNRTFREALRDLCDWLGKEFERKTKHDVEIELLIKKGQKEGLTVTEKARLQALKEYVRNL